MTILVLQLCQTDLTTNLCHSPHGEMPPTADSVGVKRILLLALAAPYYVLALQRQPYHNAYPSRAMEHNNLEASAERWDSVDADSLQHTALSGQRGYRNTYAGSVSPDNERALATLSPAENSAVRIPPAPK